MIETFSIEMGLAFLLAYVLGSVPSAVWLGKLFFSTDVRAHGSGNAGATNTFRVLGAKAGVPVLILDVLKGWLAVKVLSSLGGFDGGSEELIKFKLLLGGFAVLGHVFPVFANFRGGKGIATLLGVMLAIHLQAALICLGIFIIMFVATKYVSLGSIISSFCFPVLIIIVFNTESESLSYFSLIFTIVVLITHQKNIERLLRKEENKMSINIKRRSK